MRTGVANLPLHYGKAPAWLFERMVMLARFQAFGCVLGFDWHSSGLTTTLCGALKEALRDISGETDIFVCGGKGRVSRKTPHEIEEIGSRYSIIKVEFWNDQPINIIFPDVVELKVISSPPGIHDGTDSTYKEVVLENNQKILGPQFLKEGDIVKVHVETGKYTERVKKDKR